MESHDARPDANPVQAGAFRLTGAVVAFLTIAFVTLLAWFTGDLAYLWPLYLIPIVVSTLAYEVSGALVSTTVSAALAAMLLPASAVPAVAPAMIAGFLTFMVCGVAVGLQVAAARKRAFSLDEISVIDAETGLLKREAFMVRLAQEVQRGVRHEVDVSLAVVQVSDLGSFRETFGAYKTTLLLEHMAEIVGMAVRSTDVLGRLHHDTFALVAPFTGPDQAEIIAERIKRAVCAASFEGDALEPAIQCDVRVAYASTPREATGVDALVGLAAQRLAEGGYAAVARTDGAPPAHSVVRSGA